MAFHSKSEGLRPPEWPSVAIFSSFRKFLGEVAAAREAFIINHIHVSSPPSVIPINPGAEYVRFPEDNPDMPDHEVQELVIAKALASTAIYVVCPKGYTGVLASYEIGRAMEAAAPLYFSEMPDEPGMREPARERIVDPHELSRMMWYGEVTPI
jgi:hypothetical protein